MTEANKELELAQPTVLLKAEDVANILGLSKGMVYKMVRLGLLPCIKLGATGKSVRFSRKQIAEFIQSKEGGIRESKEGGIGND